jgi:hypothetical protein
VSTLSSLSKIGGDEAKKRFANFHFYSEILHLTQNKFKGPLPNLFETLNKLVDFYVGKNSLTGTLPASIGELSNVGKSSFSCLL